MIGCEASILFNADMPTHILCARIESHFFVVSLRVILILGKDREG